MKYWWGKCSTIITICIFYVGMQLCLYVSHSDLGLKSNHDPYYFSTDYMHRSILCIICRIQGCNYIIYQHFTNILFGSMSIWGMFFLVYCIYLYSCVIVYTQDNLIMSFSPSPKVHLEMEICMCECVFVCVCLCVHILVSA